MSKNQTVLLAVTSLLLMGTSARADLKVVSLATLSGLPDAVKAQAPALAAPVTTTTYYKGALQRIESVGGVTILGADGAMLTLDPAARTYYRTASGAPSPAAGNPLMSMFKIDGKATVTPTALKKTLLGREVSQYTIAATLNLSMNGGDPSMASMFPTINLTGRQWTTESIKTLPTAGLMPAGLFTGSLPIPGFDSVKSLASEMGKIKGFPLETGATVTFVFPKDSPLIGMVGDTLPSKVTFQSTVTAISEAALPDDLFTVPAGYKQVDSPKAPGIAPTVPGIPGTASTAVPPVPPA